MNKKENKISKEIKINKKSARKNYSNQTGITLIALVVTIVVLLILAGVSLNAIFSENGIINKARDAQNKMDQATQNDLDGLNDLDKLISLTDKTTEGEVPDELERYFLGEEKKGTSIFELVNEDENGVTFIGNEIIPDAETAIEFKTSGQDENNTKILFEYKNNYYTATADITTGMTKTVEIKEYYSKKIFEGSLTLTDRDCVALTGTTDELSYSKQYKVVYTIDGQEKSDITITGQYGLFGTMAMLIDNKFVISIAEKDVYGIFKSNTEAGKEVIIKQIYEIGESENCVEENGVRAYLRNGEWGIMNTPEGDYTVPTTVKDKKITVVYVDSMGGNATFTQSFKIDNLVDPMCYISKIKVTTSDVNFIFDMESYTLDSLTELDLSECGDNIEIPTSFADSYPNVKIYVSSVVKAKYEAYNNIVAKQAET